MYYISLAVYPDAVMQENIARLPLSQFIIEPCDVGPALPPQVTHLELTFSKPTWLVNGRHHQDIHTSHHYIGLQFATPSGLLRVPFQLPLFQLTNSDLPFNSPATFNEWINLRPVLNSITVTPRSTSLLFSSGDYLTYTKGSLFSYWQYMQNLFSARTWM